MHWTRKICSSFFKLQWTLLVSRNSQTTVDNNIIRRFFYFLSCFSPDFLRIRFSKMLTNYTKWTIFSLFWNKYVIIQNILLYADSNNVNVPFVIRIKWHLWYFQLDIFIKKYRRYFKLFFVFTTLEFVRKCSQILIIGFRMSKGNFQRMHLPYMKLCAYYSQSTRQKKNLPFTLGGG